MCHEFYKFLQQNSHATAEMVHLLVPKVVEAAIPAALQKWIRRRKYVSFEEQITHYKPC